MSKKKPPAKAAPKDVAKVNPIQVHRLVRIERNGVNYPAAICTDEAPEIGDKPTLKLPNGILYIGTVFDAANVDGETIIEFSDGLMPVAPK